MWTFEQRTGRLLRNGRLVGIAYSGHGVGRNDPAYQQVINLGPLPQGEYTIGPAVTDPHLGPIAMWLEPDDGNEMFGRSGFAIHGDSAMHPGAASHGCIVAARILRLTIAASGDDRLEVIADTPQERTA